MKSNHYLKNMAVIVKKENYYWPEINTPDFIRIFHIQIKKVRELIDLKIFVEINDDIRLSRLLLNENKFSNNNPIAIKQFFNIYKNYIKTSFDQ